MRGFRLLPLSLTALLAATGIARAQIVPGGVVPMLPSVPQVTGPVTGSVRGAAQTSLVRAPFDALRGVQVRELMRTERLRVDLDPLGEPVLRGEYLAMGADAGALDDLRARGFEVVRMASEGDTLGLDIVVLRDVRRRNPGRAMQALQEAAPMAEFAYQHVYLPANAAAETSAATPAPAATVGSLRIGLVDGGVDAAAVGGMRIERFGCGARAIPQAHGTAVAARLSAGAGGTLYAADIWCGDRVGRATLGIVEALGWMARERVPVVNVSLVGADNAVLGRAVKAMIDRGHVIVAAVGNDGPAAPPLYPAAYAGVVGVSGVDGRLRVLPESGSGPHVDFSASGVAGARARGTSFAAPVVARAAAQLIRQPSPAAAHDVLRQLAMRARDLGAPGRDPRYGEGLIEPPF